MNRLSSGSRLAIALACSASSLLLPGCGVTADEVRASIAESQSQWEAQEREREEQRDAELAREAARQAQALAELSQSLQARTDELRVAQGKTVQAVNQLIEQSRKLDTGLSGLDQRFQDYASKMSTACASLDKRTQDQVRSLEDRLAASEAGLDVRLSEVEKYDPAFRQSLEEAATERDVLLGELLRFLTDYTAMLDESSMQIASARESLMARLHVEPAPSVAIETVKAAAIDPVSPPVAPPAEPPAAASPAPRAPNAAKASLVPSTGTQTTKKPSPAKKSEPQRQQ